MSTPEDEKTSNNIEVEIINLGPAGKAHKAVGPDVIHGQRLSYQVRWLILLLTIIGGVAFLFLLMANVPHTVKESHPVVALPKSVPRSLSLLDGVMYVIGADGNVYALRADTGSLLWQHKGLIDLYPVAATSGVVLLIEQQSGTLDALRVSDGTLLWHYTSPEGFTWPHIENGLVYISEGNNVKALRASDGAVMWQQKLAVQGFWAANGLVYGIPDVGSVGAFRASDGSPLWLHKIDGTLIGVDHARVYLDLWDHSVAALRTSDGSLLWHQNTVQGDTLSSLTNGVLYFMTPGGELDAFRTSDGSFLWHKQIPAANREAVFVYADDQVVNLSFQNGDRVFLRASDGFLLWHSTNSNNGQAFGSETDNGTTYFSLQNGGVDARSVTDGTLLWHRLIQGNVLQIEKGIIYFNTANGSLQAMRGSDGKLLWQRVLSIVG